MDPVGVSGLFGAFCGVGAKTGPGGVEPSFMHGAHRSQSLRVGGVEARPYLEEALALATC